MIPVPLDTYLAFVAASSLLLIIPGPTVMLVVGSVLSYGARRASWSAVGVNLGVFDRKGLEALV